MYMTSSLQFYFTSILSVIMCFIIFFRIQCTFTDLKVELTHINVKTPGTDYVSCIRMNESYTAAMRARWTHYRLGDAINGYYLNSKGYSLQRLIDEYRHFGDTIVSTYFNFTNRTNELNILYNATKKWIPKYRPDCVLHIRMGDVIVHNDYWSHARVYHNGYLYVYPKQYYERMVVSMKKYNVSSVVLVGASYHLMGTTHVQNYNKKYLQQITTFLRKHGFKVYERINCGTPDEDFAFMSSARVFVQGGGGYSRFVGRMVRISGGTVLWDRKMVNELMNRTHV